MFVHDFRGSCSQSFTIFEGLVPRKSLSNPGVQNKVVAVVNGVALRQFRQDP